MASLPLLALLVNKSESTPCFVRIAPLLDRFGNVRLYLLGNFAAQLLPVKNIGNP
jgi:hypothetical protein